MRKFDSRDLQPIAIQIDGFKSLVRFRLDLTTPFMVLIGPNGSGKSTVLQALSFLRYFIAGNGSQFFSERGWPAQGIRSFYSRFPMALKFELRFRFRGEWDLTWRFDWSLRNSRCIYERLTVNSVREQSRSDSSFEIFRYSARMLRVFGGGRFRGIRLNGSALSILESSAIKDKLATEMLSSLRTWGQGVFSLELLSPSAMRRGTRGKQTNIGHRGNLLASYLASIDAKKKEQIFKRLSIFIPSLRSIEATRKRAGWVQLRIAERFENSREVDARHISDGFLRLLAIASIPEFSDAVSMILLDEIEDGIDPHILPEFIELISQEASCMLVATSHSPHLVNVLDPSKIVLLARSNDGPTISAKLDQIEEAMKYLDYQGPGEIWAHTSTETLAAWVRSHQEQQITL